MKKSSLLLILPAIAALLVYTSCNKGGEDLNTSTPGSYQLLDQIFAKTAPLPTTQSIVVSTGGSVTSKGGTRFILPRDGFQSYTGAIIGGSVDVKVYDWLLKGDMAFAKVLPVSNNNPLYTSGQAYIEVTQNGVPVRLRKGYYITVKFPQFGYGITGDSLYLGQTVSGSSNVINWYMRDTAGRTALALDTVSLRSDSLHYIAASHFLPQNGTASFTIKLNSPVSLEQTLALALYDSTKGLFPISSAVGGKISAERVPIGGVNNKMHVAVMGIYQGQFYGGIVPIPKPMTDSTYEVIIKQTDPQAFRLQMNIL